ncbi:MAG: serine protease, partial [Bacteroidota bacterium]
IEQMTQATVQVLAMVREGQEWLPLWSGSGSIISADGLVLTNNHVVDTGLYDYDALGIAITRRSDAPPSLEYLARVVAVEPVLDLAVIRIVSDLDGNSVEPNLPYLEVGNSDEVEIGDRLRILGYPGIGGETITFTEGAVSGFTLERGVQGRAWIKTDATIAGGNSGGVGANADGQLVGIPTIVTSGSEYGQSVDCRQLADTDRDGDVDSEDSCVPVGGFINALRPINLAMPLIDAAVAGLEYEGGELPEVQEGFELDQATFADLVFSDGVTENDQPTQLWYALPDSSTRICAFWDYHGMADGLSWSSFWFINGELDGGSSITGQSWGGGMNGNWWICIFNEVGL